MEFLRLACRRRQREPPRKKFRGARRRPATGIDRIELTEETWTSEGRPSESTTAHLAGRPRATRGPTTASETRRWAVPRQPVLNPQGNVASEDRQPTMLLLDLCDVGVGTRQAHGQLVAEPEGGVVPPVERDGHDREIGPLRKLRCDEPSRDGRRDVSLVHGGNPGSSSVRYSWISSERQRVRSVTMPALPSSNRSLLDGSIQGKQGDPAAFLEPVSRERRLPPTGFGMPAFEGLNCCQDTGRSRSRQ